MNTSIKENIIAHNHEIQKEDRIKKNGYYPVLIWLTGLSGSGKSTLASGVEKELYKRGLNTYILDGDNIRKGLNSDLDFSEISRKENIRRIAEVSNLLVEAGVVVLSAFISPYIKDRAKVRELVGEENFIEVFVDCPLEECEKRDVKGLYAKARKGKIKNFTGIDSPFEKPENPSVIVQTHLMSIENGVNKILEIVNKKLAYNE